MSAVFALPTELTLAQRVKQTELRLQSRLRSQAAMCDVRAAQFDALIDGEPSDMAALAERRHAEQDVARFTRELALLRGLVWS